jgi:hypothetical protein
MQEIKYLKESPNTVNSEYPHTNFIQYNISAKLLHQNEQHISLLETLTLTGVGKSIK